jgi:large subunit ribosomal protein L14
MIKPSTRLTVADNTGAKIVECIKVLKGNAKYGGVGDIIVASVKDAIPNSPIEKGSVVRAVIVRTKAPIRRSDGTWVKFDDNAVVIIDQQGAPRGSRVFGPVARELRDKGFTRIISLAPEVV